MKPGTMKFFASCTMFFFFLMQTFDLRNISAVQSIKFTSFPVFHDTIGAQFQCSYRKEAKISSLSSIFQLLF